MTITISLLTLSIILFVIGILILLFNSDNSGDSDFLGFILTVAAFVMACIH